MLVYIIFYSYLIISVLQFSYFRANVFFNRSQTFFGTPEKFIGPHV